MKFYSVDCRHQKNGQIRIFREEPYTHVANVLASNPEASEYARLIVCDTCKVEFRSIMPFAKYCSRHCHNVASVIQRRARA
jgi:hypothetical protein